MIEAALNGGYVYRDRVGPSDDGTTVLDFYANRYAHSSAATWRTRIEAGRIHLDDEPTRSDLRLRAGSHLAYHRRPWVEPAVPWNVAVRHEDADCVVVSKPSGLPVVPDAHHLTHTLVRWTRDRYGRDASPVHRLDRATSGLVILGCHREARRALSRAFEANAVHRRYLAHVRGVALPDTLEIDVPIGPVDYPPTRTLHAAREDGAPARTRIRVLARDAERNETLVEIDLLTGRPHQIRIHLAAADAPLVGDPLYAPGGRPHPVPAGGRAALPGDGGYSLHAHHLVFAHPRSGARLSVSAEPPPVWPRR